jgi:hypothetical protein
MSELMGDANRSVVTGMVNALWAGTRLDGLAELHDPVDTLGVLSEHALASRAAIAWWHIRVREWGEALNELRRTERELMSLGTVLLALWLKARAALHAADDPNAVRTAQALLDAPPIDVGPSVQGGTT